MKKTMLLLAGTFLFAAVAHAVSIDFETFAAIEIGDLKTEASDDGVTVSHSIEFSGPGLHSFMALLPAVRDEHGPVPTKRMLSITNVGQSGVADDKATSIYIECNSAKKSDAPKCNITIIKGVIPG
jgi:hypothetical protein